MAVAEEVVVDLVVRTQQLERGLNRAGGAFKGFLAGLADHDYRHPSRAMTAYKAGMVLYVPDHIVRNLPTKKFEVVDKPDGRQADVGDSDGRRVFFND